MECALLLGTWRAVRLDYFRTEWRIWPSNVTELQLPVVPLQLANNERCWKLAICKAIRSHSNRMTSPTIITNTMFSLACYNSVLKCNWMGRSNFMARSVPLKILAAQNIVNKYILGTNLEQGPACVSSLALTSVIII